MGEGVRGSGDVPLCPFNVYLGLKRRTGGVTGMRPSVELHRDKSNNKVEFTGPQVTSTLGLFSIFGILILASACAFKWRWRGDVMDGARQVYDIKAVGRGGGESISVASSKKTSKMLVYCKVD